MSNATILIVDDDAAHRSMLRTMLRGWGYATEEADDGESAVEKVRQRARDAVLMDVRMARMDGIAALHHILDWNPATPVLIMTAHSSVDTAVEALRTGAYDYLTKPLDFDVLRHTLERALDHTRLASENRELRERLTSQGGAPGAPHGIIGRSAPMHELVEMIATVAPSEATVLITGESGTGKELVARALHTASHRSARPLVTVNCAALTETLLESELFGHERGAFTGADRRREGRFVQADGGTLFLDEIGEMPLTLQAKLLRALQQGEVQRVGSDTPLTVDVRVIAATNRDLREEAAAGRFREDLYYRLNVIAVHVPALRERGGDVPLLAAFFPDRYTEKNRKHLKGFTPQAMDLLLRHDWPGNVRELENAIERAVILATGDYVTERELPLHFGSGGSGASGGGNAGAGAENAPAEGDGLAPYAGLSLEDLERRAIIATLRETGDNKSEAARRPGITRATLHNKLKKYDLE
ncbi:sigma-54 dependent transcriptional regulator [Nitratidesulfovibrio liaohensis]|uniref:Sigma-54 dependent transcriptional regulator n=1 Tax=Nitratidesulfovibrio liaohensis TaxID=2604158 RepID=A0ABY9R1M2_9BACT|nr:sigma-54 dependent transcriptional regulator [Nitratidesulfovibrio liaohensis]WMW64440.1 sigma-54 dependent transcriptional regulator [Nitratidesulfovibrio liaohensis]